MPLSRAPFRTVLLLVVLAAAMPLVAAGEIRLKPDPTVRLLCDPPDLTVRPSWDPPSGAFAAGGPAAHPHRHGPRSDAAGYKVAPGPWSVGVVDRLVLKDNRRHKTVEVTVRYPRAKGSHGRAAWPLIVFSHGAGGSRAAF